LETERGKMNHTLIAALKVVVANSNTYLSKFRSVFKKPSLLKDWDHYVKNPEEPEEEIPDLYGGDDGDYDDLPHEEPKEIKDPKKYLTSKFKAFEKEFKAKAEFQNGNLIVHRSLTTHGNNDELIEEWDDPGYNAGVYWSWTPEPLPHWGGRGRMATMIGLVGPEAINFHKTLIKNLHPTLGDQETEIELKPGAKIEIFKLQEGRTNTLWEGSKVVKAATREIVAAKDYYHGTRADFDKFTKVGTGKQGLGFYFTPDLNEAKLYAKTLAGDQSRAAPKVFTVALTFKKPYNTMSVPDSEEVAAHFDLKYRPPRFVGGAKEHYHALGKQLKAAGAIQNVKKDLNKAIEKAGFDAIEYDLMKHIIVFNPNQIKVKNVEKI